jgi:HK97 family phage portal protein
MTGKEWVPRIPSTRGDFEAPLINANAFIATRAISDAIKSLLVSVVEIESDSGKERIIPASDHPANEIFHNPNSEHSWSDIVDFIVKSYLNDGNAVLTIERNTGPNPFVEIWPRDPRNVEINYLNHSYRFGSYTSNQIVYPRDRVLHIRDMNVTNPFWGIGRVATVREEMRMDYFINVFNSKFFEHGAVLNLMFTPDQNLTDDQHQQVLDAMSAEIGGAENAFKIFINKYAGKFESQDMKHRDIAFLDLLKTNREKIFGVFGLPPFRGGVMEFANYANALAQDLDFWNNTIQPILTVITGAFNKQVLWPIYGQNIRMQFDLSAVPAIQGDPSEKVKRLILLKEAGVVDAEYVRKELNISEDAAPTSDAKPIKQLPAESQQKIANAIYHQFKFQHKFFIASLRTLTVNGACMGALCDPISQLDRMLPPVFTFRELKNSIIPLLHDISTLHIVSQNTDSKFDINALNNQMSARLESLHNQTYDLLRASLIEADQRKWTLPQLEKTVCSTFTYSRAEMQTEILVAEIVKQLRQQNDKFDLDSIINNRKEK